MNGTVIPFRPREQVPRRVLTVRSEPTSYARAFGEIQCHLDGRLFLDDLRDALSSNGLALAYDQRTGAFRIMRAEDAAKERHPD